MSETQQNLDDEFSEFDSFERIKHEKRVRVWTWITFSFAIVYLLFSIYSVFFANQEKTFENMIVFSNANDSDIAEFRNSYQSLIGLTAFMNIIALGLSIVIIFSSVLTVKLKETARKILSVSLIVAIGYNLFSTVIGYKNSTVMMKLYSNRVLEPGLELGMKIGFIAGIVMIVLSITYLIIHFVVINKAQAKKLFK